MSLNGDVPPGAGEAIERHDRADLAVRRGCRSEPSCPNATR